MNKQQQKLSTSKQQRIKPKLLSPQIIKNKIIKKSICKSKNILTVINYPCADNVFKIAELNENIFSNIGYSENHIDFLNYALINKISYDNLKFRLDCINKIHTNKKDILQFQERIEKYRNIYTNLIINSGLHDFKDNRYDHDEILNFVKSDQIINIIEFKKTYKRIIRKKQNENFKLKLKIDNNNSHIRYENILSLYDSY